MKKILDLDKALTFIVFIVLFYSCTPNKLKRMNYKFNFRSSHHQFYIADKLSETDTDSDQFWTEDAYEDEMAIGNGIIGVGTRSYSSVQGDLTILDRPAQDNNFQAYDHVVEGGVSINSGILQVLNCPDSNLELEIPIPPNTYRVRIYSSNFKSVIDDDGDDYYKMEIWPSDDMKRRVLKRYERINPDKNEITSKPDSLK